MSVFHFFSYFLQPYVFFLNLFCKCTKYLFCCHLILVTSFRPKFKDIENICYMFSSFVRIWKIGKECFWSSIEIMILKTVNVGLLYFKDYRENINLSSYSHLPFLFILNQKSILNNWTTFKLWEYRNNILDWVSKLSLSTGTEFCSGIRLH